MCRSHDPFFQTSHRSLAYQFTINVPLLCPLFSIFRKFLHFQPCFGQNSSSLDPNFSEFSFLRPLFFKENPLPRPYILKPAWHTSTKKKLSAPPGKHTPQCKDSQQTTMQWGKMWVITLLLLQSTTISDNTDCHSMKQSLPEQLLFLSRLWIHSCTMLPIVSWECKGSISHFSTFYMLLICITDFSIMCL